jgi:membrane-bound metal-dependent hydrolase YbcI (DUF457 family)
LHERERRGKHLKKITYILGGLACGCFYSVYSNKSLSETVIFAILITLGVLLPNYNRINIATAGSPFSAISKVLFNNSGFSHSLLGLASMSGILTPLIPSVPQGYGKEVYVCLMAGYVLHLLLDFIFKGIYPLYPLKKRIGIFHIKRGGLTEVLLRVVFLAVIVFFVLKLLPINI